MGGERTAQETEQEEGQVRNEGAGQDKAGHFPPHLIWSSTAAKQSSSPVFKEATDAAKDHGATADTTRKGWATELSFLKWVKANPFEMLGNLQLCGYWELLQLCGFDLDDKEAARQVVNRADEESESESESEAESESDDESDGEESDDSDGPEPAHLDEQESVEDLTAVFFEKVRADKAVFSTDALKKHIADGLGRPLAKEEVTRAELKWQALLKAPAKKAAPKKAAKKKTPAKKGPAKKAPAKKAAPKKTPAKKAPAAVPAPKPGAKVPVPAGFKAPVIDGTKQ